MEQVECDDEYIGESARTFGERFKNHLRAPSPIYDHDNASGHHIMLDSFSIVGRGSHITTSTIKETRLIRINDPSLNRNIDKFQLQHIWDEVLLNTPGLHLRYSPPIQPGLLHKAYTIQPSSAGGPQTVSTSPSVVGIGSCSITNWCNTLWHQLTFYALS